MRAMKTATHLAWVGSAIALTSGCAPRSTQASDAPAPKVMVSAPEVMVSPTPSPTVTPPPEPSPAFHGVPGDDRTLRDVLELTEGDRSVRVARHGALRATCKGELLTPGTNTTPILPILGVMELAELDEANGCARIRLDVAVYWGGVREGVIDLTVWTSVEDLAPVVTRPTRLASAPATVFADEVHGVWLGPGLEVERLREVEGWTEVRTPTTKPQWRGFVRSEDLGLAYDPLVFEEKRPEVVYARDRLPITASYAPDGHPLAEIHNGSPITITDTHVELVDLDYNGPVAVIGFVPRALVTEPEPVDEDVWGGLGSTPGDEPPPKPNEMEVSAYMELVSRGGTPLGSPRSTVRLLKGSEPKTVVVDTKWGDLELVVRSKPSDPSCCGSGR